MSNQRPPDVQGLSCSTQQDQVVSLLLIPPSSRPFVQGMSFCLSVWVDFVRRLSVNSVWIGALLLRLLSLITFLPGVIGLESLKP